MQEQIQRQSAQGTKPSSKQIVSSEAVSASVSTAHPPATPAPASVAALRLPGTQRRYRPRSTHANTSHQRLCRLLCRPQSTVRIGDVRLILNTLALMTFTAAHAGV